MVFFVRSYLFLAIEQISYSTTWTKFKIQSKIVLKLGGYWRHVRHFTIPKGTIKKKHLSWLDYVRPTEPHLVFTRILPVPELLWVL